MAGKYIIPHLVRIEVIVKKSTKFKFMWLSLIAFILIGNEYIFFKTDYDATVSKPTANGVITAKYETKYMCGSEGKEMCYARYFSINGKDHSVNLDTYNKNKVGNSVQLVLEESSVTTLQVTAFVIHIVACLAFGIVGLYYFLSFINWSIFYSDRRTFMEHLR